MTDCEPGPAAGVKPACFADPRGWPWTVPGFAELPGNLREVLVTAPPLSPDDPAVPMLRGWLWSEPSPAELPVLLSAA